MDARALLAGKSKLSESTSTNQEWGVREESARKIGRCKIHGDRISQIADVLKEMEAARGDLIVVYLEEAKGIAHFRLMTDRN